MAKKPVVDVLSKGAIQILKSNGVYNDIDKRTRAIAAAGGPGMVARVRYGKTRVRGTVTTATRAARRAEAKNQALSRAINQGRG